MYWITIKKFWKILCYCFNVLSTSTMIHSWEVQERCYVVSAIFSSLLFLDVTLIIKLLKFCYLAEDSEDLKPGVDSVKVLTEDYEVFLLSWRLWRSQARRWYGQGSDWRSDFSFVFLLFMLHQLFIKSQWIWI